MATAKTGSFYLTETVILPAASANGSRVTGTIDLGAYVNVATGQAIAIDQVDFIWQRDTDFGSNARLFLGGSNGALTSQLVDLNPGAAFVRADNQSLIASGALCISAGNAGSVVPGDGGFTEQNIVSHQVDLFPDNYGSSSSLSEMFMVVNDTLYVTCGNDGAAVGSGIMYLTARIRARIVRLGSKDWMALALQSTASDN